MHTVKTLEKPYGKERHMRRIPVTLSNGDDIKLLPGRQNGLIKKVIADFCALYTPAGQVLYVSGIKDKWSYFDADALTGMGLSIKNHVKLPDIVVYHLEKNWLFLIEAATSHGTISPKRRRELEELFAGSKAGLVYVTAFPDRRAMTTYFDDIAWDTVAWFSESPTHLMHFNGKFLGPYED